MRPQPLPPGFDDVRKIAVLRANAIGDYVFTLPALQSLKAAYPRAELVLLGREWHRQFLAGRPGPVDRVIVVPPSRGVGADECYEEDPSVLDTFFARMEQERFDVAIQLHGGGRHSNPFVRRLGARFTVGLGTPDAAPLDRTVRYVYFQPEILRGLEVAAAAGAAPVTMLPRLVVLPEDTAEARAVAGDDRFVVLHPGAGDVRRRWPPEYFAKLANSLLSTGERVAVVGGMDDRALAAAIADAAPGIANFCSRLTLRGLVGLLSRARLVVSNDSGPLHLAEAVGTPTVGIYWCGNLVNAEPMTRDIHRPVLSWRLECPVCGQNTIQRRCEHEISFVDLAPVDEVLAHAHELLTRSRATTPARR